MSLEGRVDELLELVERHRQRECDTILNEARERAREILTDARREARTRVHQSVSEDRVRAQAGLNAAEAHLRTIRRHHLQQSTRALLESGWTQLRTALQARWRDPDARARWVQGLAQRAMDTLPHGDWELYHPEDWPPEEQAAARTRFEALSGGGLRLIADPRLTVGLRICCAGACLDGTLQGLLEDRPATEARLLALIESRVAPAETPP